MNNSNGGEIDTDIGVEKRYSGQWRERARTSGQWLPQSCD